VGGGIPIRRSSVEIISSFLSVVYSVYDFNNKLEGAQRVHIRVVLKIENRKVETLKFVGIVEKTLLVNFFLNRTTFTPPSSTLKFHAKDPNRHFLSGFK